MDQNSSPNIFDQAGKKGSNQPLKKTSEQENSKETLPQIHKPKEPEILLTNLDMQSMFDRVLEMKKDLDKKADALKEAIALSEKDVGKFFGDPNNFTPEEWAIIQESRLDLEKRVWAVVGKDPKKVRQEQVDEHDTKHRKGKTLGSRRNWIPIR